MDLDQYLTSDATTLAGLVASGEVTASELLALARERADGVNPVINAIVMQLTRVADARAADPALTGPFAGVPFLVKDLGIRVRGMRTTMASEWVGEIVHAEDDELARRLRLAGLIFIGATNVSELAIAASSESRRFGPVRNPWDLERTAGGSSGGAAAAVAAGVVAAAHASDGSGSIRQPASCCGVFGFKPSGAADQAATPGQRHARMPVQHAITRSVRDSAALLDTAAGHVKLGELGALPIPELPYLDELGREPGKLRIGLSTDSPRGLPVDPACAAAATEAARVLEGLGHQVIEKAPELPPGLAAALDVLECQGVASMLASLERVRQPTEPGAELPNVLREMRDRGLAVTAQDRQAALRALGAAVAAAREIWARCDVMLTPTLAEPPLRLGELNVDDEIGTFFDSDAHFNPWGPIANWAGQPAASLPLSWSEGMPIGVQLAAAPGADALLLRLCAQLERACPWADRWPPLDSSTATHLSLVRPTAKGDSK
jgi:Asp-tRNA(Asn)/Glu-tRNA(Gln) amidotransferase A subunit family amidase